MFGPRNSSLRPLSGLGRHPRGNATARRPRRPSRGWGRVGKGGAVARSCRLARAVRRGGRVMCRSSATESGRGAVASVGGAAVRRGGMPEEIGGVGAAEGCWAAGWWVAGCGRGAFAERAHNRLLQPNVRITDLSGLWRPFFLGFAHVRRRGGAPEGRSGPGAGRTGRRGVAGRTERAGRSEARGLSRERLPSLPTRHSRGVVARRKQHRYAAAI